MDRQFKPTYSVVTGVLVVFALLAFAKRAFIGFIPRTSNALATSRQRFLAAAGHQEIVWHMVDRNTFDTAKRLDKPILLVVGLSATRQGHEIDSRTFEDPDTARFVSQTFYCVRADGYEHPDWLNALLPFTRLPFGIVPSYQMWILDNSGNVVNFITRTYEMGEVDTHTMYRALLNARDTCEFIRTHQKPGGPVANLQGADLQSLEIPPKTLQPSLAAYMVTLGTRSDPHTGGFPQGNVQELFPSAWRFLTLVGNHNLWMQSCGPLLLSKLFDVQDGGFFRLGFGRGVEEAELGKNTRQNAEMLQALAVEGQITDDSFETTLARQTFDWLLTSLNRNGLLPACQDDDESPQGRSPRYSYPLWRLHDVLTSADRDWSYEHLGLDSTKNRQMVPYLTSRSTLLDFQSTYSRVIQEMRLGNPQRPTYNDGGYLDVNGHSLARMWEVSRLWNDTKRQQALKLADGRLKAFEESVDLMHFIGGQDRSLGYLGDFLGFCDLRLNEYLATGQVESLQEGLRYLNIARTMFKGKQPGQFNLSRDSDSVGRAPTLVMPEIVDNAAESCTAQLIRLDLAYGRLTANTPAGQDLLSEAQDAMSLFADTAIGGGPMTAGYFCAVADLLDGRYAIAVGPEAKRLSDGLFRLAPTRFVAPAMGNFRKDLQSKRPGIYLIGKDIQGPYSVEDAADLLPISLSLRATP